MPLRMKPVDVVLVGVGWTGGILAKELAEAGYRVVGLERGGFRQTVPDFQSPSMHDELKYAIRHGLMQDLSVETITFRNFVGQRALPMRQLGSFYPGTDLGGAGVHWNGQTWRFLPADFKLRRFVTERYRPDFIPDDLTIQDWPLTYEELEPFYAHFEDVCGIAGPGEGSSYLEQAPRSRPYPNPPMKTPYASALFRDACERLGYRPFHVPSANITQLYTNPFGARLKPCMYCGFCEYFGCEHYAKASPQITVLPFALANENFELRTHVHVTRINHDPAARRATGVTYIDGRGREVEQPAETVVLCAFAYNNVRLLLLSGIGKPYDPATGEGVVGRNYTYQTMTDIDVFYDGGKRLNPFMGAGAAGVAINEWNTGNFDYTGLGFVGGAYIACYVTSGRPIENHPVPDGTPRWGLEWKRAVARHYNSTAGISVHGSSMPHPGNYIGLDRNYTDAYGQPLAMITFDFPRNDRLMSRFVTEKAWEVAKAMGGRQVSVSWLADHYSIVPYQTTHNTGGAIMGDDPRTSAVNKYLQSWDLHNLFVMGSAVFPQNAGYNPTDTVGALAYWSAKAMIGDYLKNPRPLVPA